MTRRHDDIFDAVLSGVPQKRETGEDKGRAHARFLKRGNAISDRLSGEKQDKVLHWVDPACCRMWARHNRKYNLLNEENCRDLIEGIRAQGQQEFPAIVRRISEPDAEYEVICGARRHFAISWLRANNYPQFRYLVEVRDLSDEEAFRLADIENRDRADISDYERAVDYARAIDLYYGGKQKTMARRLDVSEVWLSRYLELSRLPEAVIAAFPSVLDIREAHARTLKPLLKDRKSRLDVLRVADEISEIQKRAKADQGSYLDARTVIARLRSAVAEPGRSKPVKRAYKGVVKEAVIYVSDKGKKRQIEYSGTMTRQDLEAAFFRFLNAEY